MALGSLGMFLDSTNYKFELVIHSGVCMAFGSGFVVGMLHLVVVTSERCLFELTAETLPGELERNAASFLIRVTSFDNAAILAFRSAISFDCCRMRQRGQRNGLLEEDTFKMAALERPAHW